MVHHIEFPGLGLSFDVNTIAFSIGSFSVQWYGIIIAVGFLLGLIYSYHMCKEMNIDTNRFLDAVIVGLIGAVICARLYYCVFYPGDKYWKDPLLILNTKEGGLAIYGGLIGALVFGGLMAKFRKLKISAVFDVVSIAFLMGQAIGRWGNFINQEAFGTATDLPWGMYSDNTAIVVTGNVHPCFLYESLLCALGFVLLHFFNKYLRRYDGQTFLLYMLWYGTVRFFIEGLRTDSLILPVLQLRVSQVLAAVSVIVSLILLIAFRRRTSLTGCGSKRVMEAVGIIEPAAVEGDGESTIFTERIPGEKTQPEIYQPKHENFEDLDAPFSENTEDSEQK